MPPPPTFTTGFPLVIDVVPALYPAVQLAAFLTSLEEFVSPFMKHRSPPSPPQEFPAVKTRNV